MRREDRRIVDAEAWGILERGEHGVLSTVTEDGAPYGVPLNYCVLDGAIYLHCALEGRKLACLARAPRVSFCVVGATRVLPQAFSTLYESCIVEGVASEAYDDEKQAALEGLVRKYAEGLEDEGLGYIDARRDETRVFRIDVLSLTGKARRA